MRSFGLRLVWIMVASVGVVMATFSAPSKASGKAGLRILCDGEARNADVTINGKPFGSCPMDIEIPAGRIDLQVSKTDANGTNRVFRESFTLVGGAVRRVEVTHQAMKPVFTQTKEETIAWILSKLRGSYPYTFNVEGSQVRIYDTKINIFDDGVLEIEWKEAWPEYRYATGRVMNMAEWNAAGQPRDLRVYATRPASVISQSRAIPIYAINSLAIKSDVIGRFRIDFSADRALCGECVYTRQSSNENDRSSRFGSDAASRLDFPFNKPSEENFEERFRNAFMHLKTFYPPPKAKRQGF